MSEYPAKWYRDGSLTHHHGRDTQSELNNAKSEYWHRTTYKDNNILVLFAVVYRDWN